MTPAELEARLIGVQAERGRRSLHTFVKLCWHVIEADTPFVDNWHIRVICEYLEAITRGEVRDLIINIPPGCMKSGLVSVFWPIWDWIHNPNQRFLYTSFDQGLTLRDAGKSRVIVLSEFFRKRWGTYTLRADDPKGDFETYKPDGTSAGGWRFSTSLEGKTTGRHPDKRIIDDPIKPLEATPENLKKVIEWYKNTFVTRARDQTKIATVLIMQRLAANDLAGYLGEQGGWEWIKLPMRYDRRIQSVTTRGTPDPRTEDGELLYPERFPEKVVDKLEIDLGPTTAAAQLQQNPTPDKGSVFERDWFNTRYSVLPAMHGVWCQSWDMAFKGTAGSDFVVGQVWCRVGANYYLMDQVKARAGFSATVQMVRDLSAKWPKALTKLIEDKANGSAVIDTLKKELSGLVPIEPEGGKIARANAITGIAKAGNIHLPERAAWVGDLVESLVHFPRAAHDDDVDATTQAVFWLSQQPMFSLSAAMQSARNNGLV